MCICNDDVREGARALSHRERVREARVRVAATKSFVYTALTRPSATLSRRERALALYVSPVIANHNNLFAVHSSLSHLDRPRLQCSMRLNALFWNAVDYAERFLH